MPKLSELTSKATPTTADEVVITDKADSDNTKRATLNSLPISSAQASINSAKAPLASPTFTGTVTVPTLDVSAISGQAPFADGSAAAPSITNTGDTNTGFYFPSADSVGCTVAGSLAWTTDSSGNVLVGKTVFDFTAGGFQTAGVETAMTRAEGSPLLLNRKSTAGAIATLYYNDVAVGGLSVDTSLVDLEGGTLTFTAGGTERARIDSNGLLSTTNDRIKIGDLTIATDKKTGIIPSAGNQVQLIQNLGTGGNLISVKGAFSGQDVAFQETTVSSGTSTSIDYGDISFFVSSADGGSLFIKRDAGSGAIDCNIVVYF